MNYQLFPYVYFVCACTYSYISNVFHCTRVLSLDALRCSHVDVIMENLRFSK